MRFLVRAALLSVAFFLAGPSVRSDDHIAVPVDSLRIELTSLLSQGENHFDSLTMSGVDNAIEVFGEAVALAELHFGPSDTSLASALTWQAACYLWKADHRMCDSLINRAISIWERTLGPDHPQVSRGLRVLADSYSSQERHAEMEELFLRSITALETVPVSDTLSRHRLALNYNSLGVVYDKQGRYKEAEASLLKAYKMWQGVFPDERVWHGLALLSLGNVSANLGQPAKAELYFIESAETFERVHGSSSEWLARSLTSLADLYADNDRYDEAQAILDRALEIRQNSLGEDHPWVAYILTRLATVWNALGDFDKAHSYASRAIALGKDRTGPNSPLVASYYLTLARIDAAHNSYEASLLSYTKGMELLRDFLGSVFSYASETQKLQYVRQFPVIDNSMLTFALTEQSKTSITLAAEMVFRGKAIVLDAVAAEKEAAYCSNDKEVNLLVDQYKEVAGKVATMSLAGPGYLNADTYKDSLDALHRTRNHLEAELSRRCDRFSRELTKHGSNVKDIASHLPGKGVLIEFVEFFPFDFRTSRTGAPDKKEGRYLAFVLDSAGRIEMIDLGSAYEIDSITQECLEEVSGAGMEIYSGKEKEAEHRLSQVSAELYRRILTPLGELKDSYDHLFIAPDGMLNLLPIEILKTPAGRYAIEEFEISYLSSGRDLLKPNDSDQRHVTSMLLLADPDFERFYSPGGDNSTTVSELSVWPKPVPAVRAASSCLRTTLPSLPATANEGREIADLFAAGSDREVVFLTGPKATETAVKNASGPPTVIHLATHGYYCSIDPETSSGFSTVNPLLNSGLVLAGANRTIAGDSDSQSDNSDIDDGILTSLEVSGLNLVGTDLVVLSACQTGVGLVESGEGVFGLRRSFLQAGCRSLIMSMWSVPDKLTSKLMRGFYRRWLNGQSKSSALRGTMLQAMEQRRQSRSAAHPLFWGGFVLVGAPD